ncbi:Protoporphyrinogen oxidase [Hibiscus syriacus]|uniref:Protoporphyrinogen oxidase n=1 Tax=Hibiscus syriacus TaxID=106335 RepID=A0A6A2XGE3_HIBSY|nr:Protoporphyrinogen oxidase [Hibiscus syriacus]
MTESEIEVRSLFDDLGAISCKFVYSSCNSDRTELGFSALWNETNCTEQTVYCEKWGACIGMLLPPLLLFEFTYSLTSLKSHCIIHKQTSFSKIKDSVLLLQFQIILEPFLWKKSDTSKVSDADNQGKVVDYLVDPFVGGTSGGDPDSLSTLADMLSKNLSEDNLKLKSKVLSLSYNHDGKSTSDNWSLSYVSDRDKRSQGSSFDAVIMTAPLCNVKEMKITRGGKVFPLNFIPEVSYVPLSVIITTFKNENVKKPLEGFGVLVPSKEQQNGLKTLGTIFSSVMFPDRTPNDLHLYYLCWRKDELKHIVTSDLRQLLGVEGEPTFLNHFFWSKAFPLYGRNYSSVLEAIEKMERDLPGFFYAGNHKGRLSVGKSIASGCKAADHVISYLESSHQKLLK